MYIVKCSIYIVEVAVRQQSLCLLLGEGGSRKRRALRINCRMCVCCFKYSSAILRMDGEARKMFLLRLPEKEKRYQSWPTYWKTNFSLSSRKENLSPQEQFALRAEQRLAPGNCTAMLSQIRAELNTATDNEQLLRLKRMSKSPHSNLRLGDLAL